MMEPVFFPFTWLDADTAARLSDCFGRIQLYIPSEAARREIDPAALQHGRVEARHPFADDGSEVERLFREFLQWRQANRGTDISFFKTADANPPFFNETTISFLRQDIQRAVSGNEEKTGDASLTARVFMRLTGHYDRAQADISAALLSLDKKEAAMLAALQGDGDEEGAAELPDRTATTPRHDPGSFMTAERLSAWSLLAATEPPASLYLTTSPAVLATVGRLFENSSRVWEGIPLPDYDGRLDRPRDAKWQKDLAAFISRLQDGQEPGPLPAVSGNKNGGRLILMRLDNISPRIFLEKIQTTFPEQSPGPDENSPATTVVAALVPA